VKAARVLGVDGGHSLAGAMAPARAATCAVSPAGVWSWGADGAEREFAVSPAPATGPRRSPGWCSWACPADCRRPPCSPPPAPSPRPRTTGSAVLTMSRQVGRTRRRAVGRAHRCERERGRLRPRVGRPGGAGAVAAACSSCGPVTPAPDRSRRPAGPRSLVNWAAHRPRTSSAGPGGHGRERAEERLTSNRAGWPAARPSGRRRRARGSWGGAAAGPRPTPGCRRCRRGPRGGGPPGVVGGGELPASAALLQRGRPGQRAGFADRRLQVMVQVQARL
jgi:hypothetical protein